MTEPTPDAELASDRTDLVNSLGELFDDWVQASNRSARLEALILEALGPSDLCPEHRLARLSAGYLRLVTGYDVAPPGD